MKNKIDRTICTLILLMCIIFSFSFYYYSLSPNKLILSTSKVAANYFLKALYYKDLEDLEDLTNTYYINKKIQRFYGSSYDSWKKIEKTGALKLLNAAQIKLNRINYAIPFVYEEPMSTYLMEFKKKYKPEKLTQAHTDEYVKMLSIVNWLGTIWDHGVDPLPAPAKKFSLVDIIEAGKKGNKYWCEIAAETAVKSASALGWPSRLVTLSQSGYLWEHAIAEFWSNKYNKWFVVDTDFNVIFLHDSIPLSAFELCHQGVQLQKQQKLKIFHFATSKKSLPYIDLIPYFKYIHIDLRNDWSTRSLRRGSPTGGDISTWWTARKSIGPLITAKKKVDQENIFNWKINIVEIYAIDIIKQNGEIFLETGFAGYSPYFENWVVSIDNGEWQDIRHNTHNFKLAKGNHIISTRIRSLNNTNGPVYSVKFELF